MKGLSTYISSGMLAPSVQKLTFTSGNPLLLFTMLTLLANAEQRHLESNIYYSTKAKPNPSGILVGMYQSG